MSEQDSWHHDIICANAISFHYVEAGEGPLILLLYGFPEYWYSWRRQLTPLADAGYHVVAPDLRGYNKTEKPAGIKSYVIDQLVTDVSELIRAFGHETASLIGHDWGGFIAWEMASRCPERVERLVSVGVTHPIMFDQGLDHLDQLRQAWYMYFFQLPRLPEWAL